ncbi:aspartyl protease family protein 1-like [Wolffia australiana]
MRDLPISVCLLAIISVMLLPHLWRAKAANMAAGPLTFFLCLMLYLSSFSSGILATTLEFNFHHKFSDRARQWVESELRIGRRSALKDWPQKESIEYYNVLNRQDRKHRQPRNVSPLTFSGGNETSRISTLGFLYYADVSVGTPPVSFLVALDTGSDLFWLPCECEICAPTSLRSYGLVGKSNFNIYSPRNSSTSKRLRCSTRRGDCPYSISYVAANTSTAGILVQDILHLQTDDSRSKPIKAQITLGCGRRQTGAFLKYAAPNGLFGLGLRAISVPSALSRARIVADSFSLSFCSDNQGRIIFGDRGAAGLFQTPFATNRTGTQPRYNVNVEGIRVGGKSISGNFTALVDSGTSFTSLADPAYTIIAESFTSMVQDGRGKPAPNFSFEYCYELRSNASIVPTIGFLMQGGSEFPVVRPTILVNAMPTTFYCLGITKTTGINIIGQNFMEELKVVFDREKLMLGWEKANC